MALDLEKLNLKKLTTLAADHKITVTEDMDEKTLRILIAEKMSDDKSKAAAEKNGDIPTNDSVADFTQDEPDSEKATAKAEAEKADAEKATAAEKAAVASTDKPLEEISIPTDCELPRVKAEETLLKIRMMKPVKRAYVAGSWISLPANWEGKLPVGTASHFVETGWAIKL